MEVIAFVGPSGTGKSHRATVVAHEYHIECIIDDGILIYRNQLTAGFSAKREKSRLKAVRRAIFQDAEQVADVKAKLAEIKPKRLLILGTSERMVNKITTALDLPSPSRYIRIEEVASPEEIRRANDARLKEGKHIIPLPTMELKPHFRGYLIDPIKSLLQRGKSRKGDDEKSVVRPIFSYYGKLTFTDEAIAALVAHAAQQVRGALSVQDISIRKTKGTSIGLELEFSIVLLYGVDTRQTIRRIQRAVQKEIEYTTGMSVNVMKISVRDYARPER